MYGAGGQYMLAVLKSDASEAQKVQALQTAGITAAKKLSPGGEHASDSDSDSIIFILLGVDALCACR